MKIQSHVRGRLVRKQARQGKYYGSKRQHALISIDYLTNYLYLEYLSDEEGLEFREEVVFPDGTVYKGQLKDG